MYDGAMKPGWQTSEFWITLATSGWAIFGSTVTGPVAVVVPAVLGAAYAISRGLAKRGGETASAPAR